MPRTMYDSITASDIPLTAAVVLGYVNGTYEWSTEDWARFPHAVKVRCATRANIDDGHVLDVETGDATPAQAPGWVVMRRRAGLTTPTVYCSSSAWPSVRAAFRAAGVAEPLYLIAHYDGDPTIPAGAVGKQYVDPPNSGGHWDLSAVADHWPGVDPAPKPEAPQMELTDKLPTNPTPGTVAEALTTGLHGIGGVRSAGELYLLVYNLGQAVTKLSDQLAAVAGAVAALKAVQGPGTLSGDATVTVHLTPGN